MQAKWLDDESDTGTGTGTGTQKYNSIDCKQTRWRLNGFQECWLHFYVCVRCVCQWIFKFAFQSQILAVCLLLLFVCMQQTQPTGGRVACLYVWLIWFFLSILFYTAFVCTQRSNAIQKQIWMYKIAYLYIYMQCIQNIVYVYDAILIVCMNGEASVYIHVYMYDIA